EVVHVEQDEHDAVDAIVQRAIGPEAQDVPAPVLVPYLELLHRYRVHDLPDHGGEVRHAETDLDVGDGPAHVGRDQIEHPLRHGGEPPDAQVRPQHDDGELHAGEEVDEVVVSLSELGIAIVEL